MQFLKERKLRLVPNKQYTIKDKEFRIKKVSSLSHSNGGSFRTTLSPIPSLALLNLKPASSVGVKLKKTVAFPRGNKKHQRLETTCAEVRRGPFLSQCQIPSEVVYQHTQIRPNTISRPNQMSGGGLLRVKSEGVFDFVEEKTSKKERVMVHNPFAQRQKRANKFEDKFKDQFENRLQNKFVDDMRESGILRNESCLSAAGECQLAGIMSILK